jgi:hypothetical protein
MRKQTYRMLVVALASMLVAPPLSAFAQREQGPQGARSAPNTGARVSPHGPRVVPHSGERLARSPVRSHNFRGHVFHGQLAWRNGRWHHATRNGRFGWWWDVGGVWYYYPEAIEGPPDYVSDIEAVDEETTPPPSEPHYTFYYRPGDLLGTRYQTFEECSQARQQAGDIGICVIK